MALTQSKFRTTAQLNTAFSRKISKLLRDGIEENGRVSLIVSGGSTPAGLFNLLSKSNLEWDKVDISLAGSVLFQFSSEGLYPQEPFIVQQASQSESIPVAGTSFSGIL